MKTHYSHSLSSSRIAQIVGSFVLIPLIVLVLVGLFMAEAQHVFEGKYHLRTSLSKSYGLEPGAPVLVSGIPIGRVELVDLNDRGTVDVLLQLRARYHELVRGDSELGITKSGVVVGQTQVAIGMGSQSKPVLPDGAVIKAVEPQDIGELVNEVKPVLDAVKQTLLRTEEITRDVQTTIQTAGRALAQVEQATRELPAMIASVQRTVTSVEQTAAALPMVTGSISKSLAVVDGIARDVKAMSGKLPAVIDSAQSTVQSVKTLTESVNRVTQELAPLLESAQTTMNDVSTIIRGAKQTFPISRFVRNAGDAPSSRPGQGMVSIRGDQLDR
ncbi:MAG: MCE family protein [Nitrospirae bacterium]|nr:MAG: MCE family protein [Nitrospirota bacterium]